MILILNDRLSALSEEMNPKGIDLKVDGKKNMKGRGRGGRREGGYFIRIECLFL